MSHNHHDRRAAGAYFVKAAESHPAQVTPMTDEEAAAYDATREQPSQRVRELAAAVKKHHAMREANR